MDLPSGANTPRNSVSSFSPPNLELSPSPSGENQPIIWDTLPSAHPALPGCQRCQSFKASRRTTTPDYYAGLARARGEQLAQQRVATRYVAPPPPPPPPPRRQPTPQPAPQAHPTNQVYVPPPTPSHSAQHNKDGYQQRQRRRHH
ncbi:hypothetical protein HaLaN_07287 [Haematococcus lacustris]|uniref:Uncharacterized protein n=1 Tax=Haematococcus lacustris TaxID=44745 RepID=A0A699YVV5_HAELA|nr:hypothetical protein HaLaN_07287 [Haematococcus lacustris]